MSCILVVDADENLSGLVARFLESRGHQVVCASSNSAAIRSLQHVGVDLMILDIPTCMIDGPEASQVLGTHAALQGVPVLFLTYLERYDEGVSPGASLFKVENAAQLHKPFQISELEWRVSALLRQGKAEPPAPREDVLRVGDLSLDLQTFRLNAGCMAVLLTPREFGIVRYLVEHAGAVISSERLLKETWRDTTHADSPEVVRWHIKNIRLKINLSAGRSTNIIQTVPRHGYTIPKDVK